MQVQLDVVNRKTYLDTEESNQDMIMKILEDMRKKSNDFIQFFQAYQKYQKIRNRPELISMIIQFPQLIKKIIKTCLQPESLEIKNSYWPFFARDILIQNGAIINSLFFENISCLFQFLKQKQINQTALGYFSEIISMNCFNKQQLIVYQDKLLQFLIQNNSTLQLSLSKSYNPEIFKFLFQCITVPDSKNLQKKTQILSKLFNKILDDEIYRLNYCQNVCDILETLKQNINQLSAQLICIIVKSLERPYIDKIIATIKTVMQQKIINEQNQQICEFLLQILCNIMSFYKKLKCKNQPQNHDSLQLLQFSIISMISNIQSLSIVLKVSETSRKFSIGQEIIPIKFIRYYYIKYIRLILQLDKELVEKNYDMSKKGLLILLQKYFILNRWNNLVHLQIEKIIELLINKYQNYINQEERYISKQGFLCFLIENFRSRYFLFIDSNNMSTYGNTHIMYLMAKNISIKLSQQKKLKQLMQKFEPWEKFITQDLQRYEQQFNQLLGGEKAKEIQTIKKQNTLTQFFNQIELKNLKKYFEDLQNDTIPTNVKIVDYKFQWIYYDK